MMLDYFYGQSGELFAYYRIPKALFQDSRFRQLSTDARTLYGILLDRMSLSAKNSWVDEHGRVYIIYTVREVQESLCCAEHKAVKLFRELEQADLIERKRRGLGRPSLIYVKNFSSGLPKAQIQNCANSNSCAAESAVQVRPKSQSNKTDKNKTERSHPFLPDETDRLTQREQLEDYFYQALEVELLLRLCPDDEDAIYQIVDLLVDTCSTKRKMLRIAGDDKPVEVVRSRLKKLNADHIRFVLGCLAENTSPVRNMKQYLLAALFNAPTTMNLYILLDCTPSLGMLTVNALAAADTTLIPMQAQYLSAKGLEQLLQTIGKVRRQINPKLKIEGILLTMMDSRTTYGKQIDNLIRQGYGRKINVFEQTIPHSVRAAEISTTGESIYQHDPKGKVAAAYQSLTREVLANAEKQRKLSSERIR